MTSRAGMSEQPVIPVSESVLNALQRLLRSVKLPLIIAILVHVMLQISLHSRLTIARCELNA